MSTPRRRRKDRASLDEIGTLATVPTATGYLNPVESVVHEPSHDEVARRAYQLYEERGGEHGRDREDWFQAERKLQHLALLRSIVDRALASEGPYAAA